jgi:hypothetical protein
MMDYKESLIQLKQQLLDTQFILENDMGDKISTTLILVILDGIIKKLVEITH